MKKPVFLLMLFLVLPGCAGLVEKYNDMSQTGKNTTAAIGTGTTVAGVTKLAGGSNKQAAGFGLLSGVGAWFVSDKMQNASKDLTQAFQGTNIDVKPLEGDKEKLQVTMPINFASGSSQLPKEMKSNLTIIGKALNKYDLKAQIIGHTDTRGNQSVNQTLSEERAQRVERWMYTKGAVDKKKLSSVGMGSDDLFNEQNGEDPANRRIEFIISKT